MTNWRDERRGAENLVREGADAFAWAREMIAEHGPLPCVVSHEDAGGLCQRKATMEVYGLGFCEVHGAEAKAGALEELYHDAMQEILRPLNPDATQINPEAAAALEAAADDLFLKHPDEAAAEEALERAFPLIMERVSVATVDYVEDPHSPASRENMPPYEVFCQARHLVHKLMRVAYENGEDWLVETLEPQRETVAAQAAYALVLEREAGVRTALS
jgi:hypothetical protein